MNLQVLQNELTTDELGRGYSEMSDAEAADDLNIKYRTINVTSLNGDDLFQATDAAEFGALSDHKQVLWLSFCGRGSIDPWGSANVIFVQYIFGNPSTTVNNLASLRTRAASRAEELDLGRVRTGDIQQARSR